MMASKLDSNRETSRRQDASQRLAMEQLLVAQNQAGFRAGVEAGLYFARHVQASEDVFQQENARNAIQPLGWHPYLGTLQLPHCCGSNALDVASLPASLPAFASNRTVSSVTYRMLPRVPKLVVGFQAGANETPVSCDDDASVTTNAKTSSSAKHGAPSNASSAPKHGPKVDGSSTVATIKQTPRTGSFPAQPSDCSTSTDPRDRKSKKKVRWCRRCHCSNCDSESRKTTMMIPWSTIDPKRDVLLGRGSRSNLNPGNRSFLLARDTLQDQYKIATDISVKRSIIHQLIQLVHDRGGRFLERVDESNHRGDRSMMMWFIASPERIHEKAAQALRDKKHRTTTSSPVCTTDE